MSDSRHNSPFFSDILSLMMFNQKFITFREETYKESREIIRESQILRAKIKKQTQELIAVRKRTQEIRNLLKKKQL